MVKVGLKIKYNKIDSEGVKRTGARRLKRAGKQEKRPPQ